MAQYTYVHEGRTFGFDLVVNVYERTAEWHANVFRDGKGVGQRHGSIRREVVTPENWNAEWLAEQAAIDVSEMIRSAPDRSWD